MNEQRTGPIAAAIRRHRLIAVLRRIEPREKLLALVDELADAGLRAVEITFDAPSAADDIGALRRRLDARSDGPFVIGAGTVLTIEQLRAAQASGADFGVAPVLDLDLLGAAVDDGFPFISAGMTPSELRAGWLAGATFVKLFPASAVGPKFVRDVRGPLREIEVVPTGGIDAGNAQDFLDAGAAAVGIGSALVKATPAERRALIARLAQ